MGKRREFLTLYTVRVRYQRVTDWLDFSTLANNPQFGDLFEIVSDALQSLEKKPYLDTRDETITQTLTVHKQPNIRHVYGLVKSGNYGSEGSLVNAKSLVSQDFTEDDATLLNYYFNFFIPKSGDCGLFALHSRGNFGCKTAFYEALKDYLKKKYPELQFAIQPLEVDFKESWKEYAKHFKIQKIKATAFKPLRNEDKLIKGKKVEAHKVTIERVLGVGKSGGSLFKPTSFAGAKNPWVPAKATFKRYVEVPGEVLEEGSFQITLKMGTQQKTMYMGEQLEFHLSFDLTDDLLSTRGQPTLAKLHSVCRDHINHAKDEII
jgi:hypothetical protein